MPSRSQSPSRTLGEPSPSAGFAASRWPTPTRSEPPGALIVGRYALFGEIASGGMATVHFGRLLGPAGFTRVVAIKRLHPQLAKEAEFVSMFIDEVRLAARVQHPNVVATLDVAEEAGELFLVMEYVHGESLAQLIRLSRARGLQVPPAIASSIVCGLLHGLHAAHEATSEAGEPLGIIHRDVSPQNVLVGSDGVTRVLDFGIARAARRLQTTREGQLKGKAAYLAPERIHGREADRRSDVYGAAVVLWETLTGVRLFDGENDAVVLAQVVAGAIEPPSRLVPGIPPALEAITLRGMDRDPEKRFESARDMALALQQEVGLVPPNEVGDWVASVAADQLTYRSRYLAQLDKVALSEPSPPRFESSRPASYRNASEPHTRPVQKSESGRPHAPSKSGSYAPPSSTDGSSASISNDLAPSNKRGRARVVGAILFLAAVAVIGAIKLRPAPASLAPTVVPAAQALTQPTTATIAPIAAVPDKVAEPAPDPVRPIVEPTPQKASPPMRARPAKSTSAPKSNDAPSAPIETAPRDPCRPPYTVDSSGVKHFKIDCVIDGRR
jgi:serine/threonine-protein kinase